jgi:hypothetical protein
VRELVAHLIFHAFAALSHGGRRSRGRGGWRRPGKAQPYRTAGAIGAGGWVRESVAHLIFSRLRSLTARRTP